VVTGGTGGEGALAVGVDGAHVARRHVDLYRGRETLRHCGQQPRLGRAAADVAVAALRRGEHDVAVVGGRVLQAGRERILDGPQPGECGGRVVVETHLVGVRLGLGLGAGVGVGAGAGAGVVAGDGVGVGAGLIV
jgi:hypothetical protein